MTPQELALILDALADAAFYRDARSHALKSAVRRRGRESSSTPLLAERDASDVHRRKAQAYEALAIKLRR